MIQLTIPGGANLVLDHVVCDVNCTLAVDGIVSDAVFDRLARLAARLEVHLLSADTFGTLHQIAARLEGAAAPVRVRRVATGADKAEYVTGLGAYRVAALGNGANDALMFAVARLGIAVCGQEGLVPEIASRAAIIAPSAEVALDLLWHPQRLVATLRS
jgi:soluble P-type ATPase